MPYLSLEVVLDRHGVYGLQRNLLVENIIDIYKQQLEKGGNALEPPLKSKESKEPMCDVHEDEKINIYCVTCQTPTCSMCKVFGQHKECEVSTLKTVYEVQKSELKNSVDLLGASNSCLQAMLTQMEETCKTVEENSQAQKQKLGEKFDHLYAVLEDRKTHLLEQITQEQDEKVAVMRSLVQQYNEQLQASIKLIDKASQTMDNNNTAEFLIAAKQLLIEAKDATKNSHLQRPESGFESMDHFTINTEDVETILTTMDFGVGADDNDDDEEEEEEEEE